MDNKPKTFAEVLDTDLAGYQLKTVYFLELTHGLMGFFPAIIASTKKIILCSDTRTIEKVKTLLPAHPCSQKSTLMLVNEDDTLGFDLSNNHEKTDKPMEILTPSDFSWRIASKEKPFKWAPGLVNS